MLVMIDQLMGLIGYNHGCKPPKLGCDCCTYGQKLGISGKKGWDPGIVTQSFFLTRQFTDRFLLMAYYHGGTYISSPVYESQGDTGL